MRGAWMLFGATALACSPSSPPYEGGVPMEASAPDGDADAALPDCTPGQTRCTDTQLGVETCDATGHWGDPNPCASQACVDGACGGPCSPGQTQCSGKSIQTCDGSGHWAIGSTCLVACCNAACVDTTSDTQNCGACGNACDPGYACGASFTAFDGAQSANWNANGSATYDAANQAAELTDTGASEAGTWIFAHPITADDVTVQFDFSAGGGTGADGLAMMLETTGANALGALGGGFGVAGLAGFGVEFDTYDNGECMDDTANHTAIDSLATCGGGEPTSLIVDDAPGFTIADGAWHTVNVHVAGGAFTVTADAITQFSSYAPTGWTNGPYWLGFGGGTGGLTNVQEVRNVKVTFPKPRCY